MKKKKTAKQLLIDGLRAMGADGLCCDDCGCGLDDLMPCSGEDVQQCVPAKARPMTPEELAEHYGEYMHDANCAWYSPMQSEEK